MKGKCYKRWTTAVVLVVVACMSEPLFAQHPETEADSLQQASAVLAVLPADDSADGTAAASTRYEQVWQKRKKYLNIGYMTGGDLKPAQSDYYGRDSKFGVSLNWGRTYYLHKKPLLGLMKFGIDATFLSLNYNKLGDDVQTLPEGTFGEWADFVGQGSGSSDSGEDDDLDIGSHKIDAGLQVGPSLTVNPVGQLKVSAYFRYCPTYSMLVLNDTFTGRYVSMFDYGVSVAYRAISVGVEHRFGRGKYKCPSFFMVADSQGRAELETSATHFYIGFRF